MADREEARVTDEENIFLCQKREKKDLQARIQEMKNALPKGDKRKKKELLAKISHLAQDLEQRHSEQRKQLKSQETQIPDAADSLTEDVDKRLNLHPSTVDASTTEVGRISKTQKRRDKKATAAMERETRIADEAVINLQGERHLEAIKINTILKEMGFALHQIPSDGDCMYQALAHQLKLRNAENPKTVAELRSLAANKIRDDRDNFLPFLSDPQNGEPLTLDQFDTYCSDLKNTKAWGGHIELKAISEVLKFPIQVIQASGPNVLLGEEFQSSHNPLLLSYHRYAYGLGEHYNSVVPWSPSEESFGVEENNI